jgi:hypothetical protein
MLIIKDLRPSNPYLPWDNDLQTKVMKDIPSSFQHVIMKSYACETWRKT